MNHRLHLHQHRGLVRHPDAGTTPRPGRRSASVLTVMCLLGANASAQDDEVVYNGPSSAAARASSTPAPSTSSSGRPVRNLLASPDTSGVIPDAGSSPYTAGVMVRSTRIDLFQGRAVGSFGIPYTTARVQDGNLSASGYSGSSRASATYPYRAVGKLNFSAGYCTASLIRRSVIVTAAHCIQPFGSGSATFTNFRFVPGHYGASGSTSAQQAPHGTWTWAAFMRPSSWSGGTDVGSGAARDNDLAVIVLRRDSLGRFIGDITGWFAYGWNNYGFASSSKTGNLNTAAMTTLGYPFLMDSGAIMQRTDGPTYTTTVGGSRQLWQGSNFTGGSSGGPWVVNFRGRTATLAGGAVPGASSVMAVVGVTSWGSSDPNAPKDNYSSQFGQNSRYPNASYGVYGAGNIGSLLNSVCNATAPEGGTFASRGYCN